MNASDCALIDVVPLGGVPGTYTYRVTAEQARIALPGRRVLVPFGTRVRAAISLGRARSAPESGKLRDILDVLDDGPLVVPEVLELTRWAARYYCAPLSHALRAALPPGSEVIEHRTARLTPEGERALAGGSVPASTRRALLALKAGQDSALSQPLLLKLQTAGLIAWTHTIDPGGHLPMLEWAVLVRPDVVVPAHHHVQHAVWNLLKQGGAMPLEALQAVEPNARDAVRRLEKKGLLRIERRALTLAANDAFARAEPQRVATDAQSKALAVLVQALDEPARTFLLEGVTGSGKTEVYLQLIAAARARARTALVLVPEIALTPQISARFRARFGPEVAVLHSGLTDRDRRAEWHRVRRGEAPIVVGARSALFAPLERPGVIIVDEEHDASFKQSEGLRYNGRDLAVVRARLSGAVCVLGSATPSLETLHNAATGRYSHLRLAERVDARPMPRVDLVDLRGAPREPPVDGVTPSGLLSPGLIHALQATRARGEQSIVFLNRRGHSTALLCRDCGEVHRCESCAVAMTWHEGRGRLVCHYCGAREGLLELCLHCGSARLLLMGAGTEKVEEELAQALPGASVARLDRDSASSAAKLEALLSRFGRGDIDVLVGTQMLAKGHDFPNVTLVAVLLADAALHQPDFRSAERTAQLLTQVAGRAGRGTQPGRVLVQTFNPDAPAVAAVVGHDYAAFALNELVERRQAGYPPFARLCLVRLDGEREAEVKRVAAVLARAALMPEGATHAVVGPAPAPVARLRKRHRFQFLIRGAKASDLHRALDHLLPHLKRVPSNVRVSIDVDPVDML